MGGALLRRLRPVIANPAGETRLVNLAGCHAENNGCCFERVRREVNSVQEQKSNHGYKASTFVAVHKGMIAHNAVRVRGGKLR